jgi:hypothetical protein
MRRKFTTPLLVLPLAAAFMTSLPARPSDESETLIATAEITSQKACLVNGGYDVEFTVRMRLTNPHARNLIIDKTTGQGPCDAMIAADREHFIDKKYEYNVIIDREEYFIHNGVPVTSPEDEMKTFLQSPEPRFAILVPGKSLQNECVCVIGNIYGRPGSLRPGSHVLGFWVRSWPYRTKPEVIHQQWEPIGHLVSNVFLIGPLTFTLPPIEKAQNCPDPE